MKGWLFCLILILIPALSEAVEVRNTDKAELCLTLNDGGHVTGESPVVIVTRLNPSTDTKEFYNFTTPGWDSTWNATNHRGALTENSNSEEYCRTWDRPSGDPTNYNYKAIYRNAGAVIPGVVLEYIFFETAAPEAGGNVEEILDRVKTLP